MRAVFIDHEKKCTGRLADHDEIIINWKHLQFLAFEVLNELIVALPVTNTTKYGINSLHFRGVTWWNIIATKKKKRKLSRMLPEVNKKLQKQLIPYICAVYRF